jgi:hypothetical protein
MSRNYAVQLLSDSKPRVKKNSKPLVARTGASNAAPLSIPAHGSGCCLPPRSSNCRLGINHGEEFHILVPGFVRPGRVRGRAPPPGRRGAGRDGVGRRRGCHGPEGVEVGDTEAGVGRAGGRGHRARPAPRPPPHPQLRRRGRCRGIGALPRPCTVCPSRLLDFGKAFHATHSSPASLVQLRYFCPQCRCG